MLGNRILAASLFALALSVPLGARAQDYAVSDTTEEYQGLAADQGTTLFTDSDDGFAAIDLPFAFRLYGKAYTKAWVSVNGAITFSGVDSVTGRVYQLSGANVALPSSAQPNALVAAFWDDWVANPAANGNAGSRVAWEVQGSAPNRFVLVDWKDVQLFGATAPTAPAYSFSLRLYEGSDQYEIRFGPVAGTPSNPPLATLSGTSGSENAQGTTGFNHFSCTNACGSAVFVPGTGKVVSPNLNPELGLSLALDGAGVGAHGDEGPAVVMTVTNAGKSGASDVAYDLYLSTDATLDPSDQKLDLGQLGLAPFTIGPRGTDTGVFTQRFVLALPANVLGPRYLIGRIDPANAVPEINKANNVDVTGSFLAGSELTMSFTGQASVVVGEKATFNLTLNNLGTRSAAAPYKLTLSNPALLQTPRTLVLGQPVALAALSQYKQSILVDIPADLLPGTYTVSAVVDPANVVPEGDETNNAAPSPLEVDLKGPDVALTQVAIGSRIGYQGLTFPVRVTLENRGPAKATNFTFSVYLSVNDVITHYNDIKVYSSPVINLAGSQPATVRNVAATIPLDVPLGTYYVGVIADAEGVVLETDFSNNVRRAEDKITIAAPIADLAVSSVGVQPKSAAGETARVTALASNVGAASAEFAYQVYLSPNATVSVQDSLVAEGRLSLAPGAQQVIAVDARVPSTLTPGFYTVGVLLDPANEVAEPDDLNNNQSAPTKLEVLEPAIAVLTQTLPDAVAGIPYDVRLAAKGGDGNFRWSTKAGALPTGLSLDASGRLSGTPLAQGLTSFIVEVVSEGNRALATYTLAVRANAASLGFVDGRLPSGRRGVAYQQQLGAVGGNPPYKFSLASGELPPGLQLALDGTVSGLPIQTGSFQPVLLVEDNAGHRASTGVRMEILPEGALTLAGTRLPEPEVGKAYTNGQLRIEGGKAPFLVETADGRLPDGLALSSDSSSSTWSLVGTPTRAGVYSFSLAVSDSRAERDLAHFVLRVGVHGISFVTVNLESAQRGASYIASIETSAKPPAVFSLVAGELPPGLKLDASGTISGTVADTASPRAYAFAVKVEDGTGGSAVGPFALDVQVPRFSTEAGGGGGCQSVSGSGLPLLLALLGALALRRRPAVRALPFAAAALVGLLAQPAQALYRMTRESGAFTTLTSANTVFDTSTDTSSTKAQPLPLPFPFKFYGTFQTSVGISTAGLMTFGQVSTVSSNTKIPAAGDPSNFIAPFWDDWRLNAQVPGGATSAVSWKLEGTAPNRVFVVEWKNVQRNSTSQIGSSYSAYSFQVRLYETSNDITIHYGGAASTLGTAPTLTGSMGIEGPGGTAGIDLSDNKCSPGCAASVFPNNTVLRLKLSPDLSVEQVTAPPSIFASTPTQVSVTVKNSGGADANNVRLRVLLSTDTLVDESDVDLLPNWQTRTGNTVLAGSSITIPTQVTVPETVDGQPVRPGIYQLLVVVDPLDQLAEVNEDNNAAEPKPVGVAPPAPDFLATRLLGPSVAEPGKPYSLTRTIRNQGNKAGVVSYKLVLSSNALASDADLVLDEKSGVELGAGQSLDLQPSAVNIPADVVPGRYWVGLIVRPADGAAELDALNNDKVLGPITLRGGALAMTVDQLPVVTAGVPFSLQLTAAGGQGDYKWASGIPAPPAGVTLSESGILAGVLDSAGEWSLQVQLSSGSTVISKTYSLKATAKGTPLTLVSLRLPIGVLGAPYAARLSALGGAPPYSWQLVASSLLPEGLQLAADGAVEGVPLVDGQSAFQVRVTDSAGARAEGEVVLPLAGPTRPLFSTRELPAAQLGKRYQATLKAAGGEPGYRFSVVDTRRLSGGLLDETRSYAGSLPQGLALSDEGVLSGTPTVAGLYVVTVRVVDSQSHDDSSTFALAVSTDADLVIKTAALPEAVVGAEYNVQLAAEVAGQAAGTGSKITWHAYLLEGAALPAGLTFTEEGKIVGFPLSAGSIGFLAVAMDEQGRYAMRPLGIRVVEPAPVETEQSCSQSGAAGLLALAIALLALARPQRLAPALARVGRKAARRGALLLLALGLAGLSACTAKAPEACAEGCGAGLVCDKLDGICKCGGAGGAVCGSGETCEPATRQCLVASCQTPCPEGTSCGADGACHCGGATGQVCAQGESCSPLGRCERADVCKGVLCAAGMTCDPSQQGQCRCGPGGPACASGEKCVDGACVADKCLGVACTGGTSCDPTDGVCKCGGSGGAVCVNGEACDTVNARCVRSSRCQGVSCRSGESCDPADGLCKCGGPGGPRCGEGQSCDPLAKKCSGGDLCQGVSCGARLSCDPEDGLCKCGGFGGAVCADDQLCVISGQRAACQTKCNAFAASSTCGASSTCRWDDVQLQQLCFPLGLAQKGDDCSAEEACGSKLQCIPDSSGFGICRTLCRTDSECDLGETCKLFKSSTIGACLR